MTYLPTTMLRALIVLFCLVCTAKADITPNENYIEAHAIHMAIADAVKKNRDIHTTPDIKINLSNARPVHVYALLAALNEKISIYFSTNNLAGYIKTDYPNIRINPTHVRDLLLNVHRNLNVFLEIKTQKKLKTSNKSPKDVMYEVTQANFWMDTLLGGVITPKHPYLLLFNIEHELVRLSEHLNIQPLKTKHRKFPALLPEDVFANSEEFYQLLSAVDKKSKSTHSHNRSPIHSYNIPSGNKRVMPIHVFTMTAFNLNYLYAIETMYGLKPDYKYKPEPSSNVIPADVYAKYDKVNTLLHRIAHGLKLTH
jgi:hypothetical protein